jgi:hypothetical protein
MLQLGSGLILIPEHDRFRQLCDRVAQTFASHGIQAQDLLATLPEARQQVFEHHYPESSARKSARKKAKRQ